METTVRGSKQTDFAPGALIVSQTAHPFQGSAGFCGYLLSQGRIAGRDPTLGWYVLRLSGETARRRFLIASVFPAGETAVFPAGETPVSPQDIDVPSPVPAPVGVCPG